MKFKKGVFILMLFLLQFSAFPQNVSHNVRGSEPNTYVEYEINEDYIYEDELYEDKDIYEEEHIYENEYPEIQKFQVGNVFEVRNEAELANIINSGESRVVVLMQDVEITRRHMIEAGQHITLSSPIGQTFSLTKTQSNANQSANINRHFAVRNDSHLTIENVEITTNLSDSETTHRGGIYVNGATLTMNDGIISNNKCTRDGGISLTVGSTFEMNGGEISYNRGERGGGIGARDSIVTINYGAIKNNTVPRRGGGILVERTVLTIYDARISGNIATYGGGINVESNSEFTLNGGEIFENTAIDFGGGFQVRNSTFTMNDGKIHNNISELSGGGIALNGTTNRSDFIINGGIIKNNEALGNVATYNGGGGIHINNVTVTINDVLIENNITRYNVGGGILLGNTARVTMNGGIITGNTARQGGGIRQTGNAASYLTINSGTISNNHANQRAGGIWSGNSSNTNPLPENSFLRLRISPDVVFSGNTAGWGAFPPPINALTATNINNTTSSARGFNHPLNNYDIQYTNNSCVINVNDNAQLRAAIALPANHNNCNWLTIQITSDIHLTYVNSPNRMSPNSRVVIRSTPGNQFTLFRGYTHHRHFNLDTAQSSNATLRLENIILEGNADNQIGTGGGIVSGNNARIYLESGAIIRNNRHLSGGGGLHIVQQSTVIINGGEILNNFGLTGGGVFSSDSTIVINSGEVRGNEASQHGGGIHATGGNANIVFNDGSINNNRTVGVSHGGGVTILNGATLTMNGGMVNNNTADGGGGVNLQNNANFILNDGEIRHNRIRGLTGGGVRVITSQMEMNGGSIFNNEAGRGGGIGANVGEVIINDGQIYNNYSRGSGGGVFLIDNSSLVMNSGEIRNNYARDSGGGTRIEENSHITINNGSIRNNRGRIGGGINSATSSTITIRGGEIYRNQAWHSGGGIRASISTINIDGGLIHHNSAIVTDIEGWGGGGVYIQQNTQLTMTDGIIEHNYTENHTHRRDRAQGGGIRTDGVNTYVFMTGGTIRYNSAFNGGGVHIGGGTTIAQFENGSIVNNQADANGGGINAGTAARQNVLEVSPQFIFNGNRADNGVARPPSNFNDFPRIQSRNASIHGHPLNNWDITFPIVQPVNFTFLVVDLIPNPFIEYSQIQRLQGVTFTLERYYNGWTTLDTFTSDELGQIELLLDPHYSHRITQNTAPEGFRTPMGYWIININQSRELEIYEYGDWIIPFFYNEESSQWYLGGIHEFMLPDTGSTDSLVLKLVATIVIVIPIIVTAKSIKPN